MNRLYRQLRQRTRLYRYPVLLLIAAMLIMSVLSGCEQAEQAEQLAFYVKDQQIYCTSLDKINPIALTSDFHPDTYPEEQTSYLSMYTGILTKSDPSGKRVVYPEKFNLENSKYTLFHRDLSKDGVSEPFKIVENAPQYLLPENSDHMIYLGTQNDLYQYNFKTKKNEKLSDDIYDFFIFDKGKRLIYGNNNGDLFEKIGDQESQKIDSEVTYFLHAEEEDSTLFYHKSGALYKKAADQPVEQIDTGVTEIIKAYDSGQVYYLKFEEGNLDLTEFIEDDMLETDAVMKAPETPQEPNIENYATNEEYLSAMNSYHEQMAEVQKFSEMTIRSELRYRMETEKIKINRSPLYYFDGKNTSKLIDYTSFVPSSGVDSRILFAKDKPILGFWGFDKPNRKIPLSTFHSIYDLDGLLSLIVEKHSYQYLACENRIHRIGKDSDYPSDEEEFPAPPMLTYISPNGKKALYINNVNTAHYTGDLNTIDIVDNKPQEPQFYDHDVSFGSAMLSDDKIIYHKLTSAETLYLNKEKLADYAFYSPIGKTYPFERFLVNHYNDTSGGAGSLFIYEQNQLTKIADLNDAFFDFYTTPSGDVFYIKRESTKAKTGDLYLYVPGKEDIKIDSGVHFIIHNRLKPQDIVG